MTKRKPWLSLSYVKKEEFKYKDVVEAKWCDVVMRIFALSPPKEDLAELAEAIAIGLGGSPEVPFCVVVEGPNINLMIQLWDASCAVV